MAASTRYSLSDTGLRCFTLCLLMLALFQYTTLSIAWKNCSVGHFDFLSLPDAIDLMCVRTYTL